MHINITVHSNGFISVDKLFNTFSLYDHNGPTLKPDSLDAVVIIFMLGMVVQGYHNHAFIFLQICQGVKEVCLFSFKK